MSARPAVKLPLHDSDAGKRDATDEVRDEESPDLVFGLVGYLGAGASWVATQLSSVLQTAGFDPKMVKLSKLLEQRRTTKSPNKAGRTEGLQDFGDQLRRDNGSDFIAAMGVHNIYEQRGQHSGRAQAFVIDQLKHPKEVELLRAIYGQSFYLISVVCSESTRRGRLRFKYKGAENIEELIERDHLGLGKQHGQRVHKTFHLGDLFVVNEGSSESAEQESLSDDLGRFVDAITGRKVVRPRPAERGMHAAWVASLRSACMSRQVGAAITDARGELVAVGRNDPPSFNGGLYGDGDDDGTEHDYRCYRWTGNDEVEPKPRPYCRNDMEKKKIYEQILTALSGVLASDYTSRDIEAALASTKIRDLIEFSRAVHAEMDALISLARKNGPSPVGGTLYCTTYPCHSCARHIVAAGIHEVVYIEPYDKSMAMELHSDTISDDPSRRDRVRCRLFSGVAPRRFARLFEKRTDLKRDGYYHPTEHLAGHADPVLKKSFLDLEKKVADEVDRQFGGPTA